MSWEWKKENKQNPTQLIQAQLKQMNQVDKSNNRVNKQKDARIRGNSGVNEWKREEIQRETKGKTERKEARKWQEGRNKWKMWTNKTKMNDPQRKEEMKQMKRGEKSEQRKKQSGQTQSECEQPRVRAEWHNHNEENNIKTEREMEIEEKMKWYEKKDQTWEENEEEEDDINHNPLYSPELFFNPSTLLLYSFILFLHY